MSSRTIIASTLPALLLGAACSPDSGLKVTNDPPTAELLSHLDGDEVLEGSVLNLRGKGSDPDDDAPDLDAAVWVGGALTCDWAPLDEDGVVECEALVPAAADLSDARLGIELEVRDPNGAADTTTVLLQVISTDAPDVSILEPLDGQVAYADQPLTLHGLATDDLDDPDQLLADWASDLDGSVWSTAFDADGEVEGSVTLSAGTHVLSLTATDTADRASTERVQVEVFATNTDPTCALTAPDEGVTGRPDEPTTLSATVSDEEDPLEALELTFSSDLDGVLGTDFADSTGRLSLDVSGMTVGTHQLTLRVDDQGGGRCTDTRTYTIGSPPLVELTAPTDGDVVNEGDTVDFAATITDGEDAPPDLSVVWSSDLDGALDTSAPDASGSAGFSLDSLRLGTHEITVEATDLDGQATARSVDLVVNGLPDAPEVSLSPDPAVTGDPLVVSVDVASTDPEGDTVAYSYVWDVGGVVSSASTSATLPASATAKGEVWTVTVTPTDGYGDGPAATASVTVDNSPPVLAAVTLGPSPATVADTLTCTPGAVTDADGDTAFTYAYTWTVDGTTVAATTDTLTSAVFSWGEDVICAVVVSDGTDTSAAVSSGTVTIDNSVPSISSVSITPTSPAVSDTLTCSYSGFSDADGDADASTIEWSIGGTVVGTSTTLSSGFSSGDSVTCTVTPSDGTDTGTAVSTSVTVDNTAPSISSVTITPSDPTVSDTLTCSYSGFFDADGDADVSTYSWAVGGVVVGSSSTLSGVYSAGDTVTCTVTPSDGSASGTALTDAVVIDNSAPVLASVALTPTAATEGDTFTCTPGTATDADGDSVSYSYAWTVNSSAVGHTGSTLDDSYWARGETVVCSVTPTDGTDAGTAVSSNAVVVGNAAPSISSVSISPSAPSVTDDLTCSYTGYSDPDGDADQSIYAWTVNGVSAGASSTLSASSFTTGDTVACGVTPYDGTDTGTMVSASVSVGNSAPSITSVSITPASAQAGDTLTCSYAGYTDADGDPDQSTYAWTIDGASAGTSSTLSSGFGNGDTVACTVTPYDGTSTGTALADSLTISNTPPVISSVSLSPTTVQEGDTLSCAVTSASDADGESISYTYAWTVDGSALSHTGTTLSSTSFSRDDAVVCTVTPSDGTDTGTAVDSNTVVVSNTAPALTSVSVSPASPTVSSTLTCTPAATDADGDTITYTYDWTVGGTSIGASSTLSSGFSSGDTVTCTVTPEDGTDSGSSSADAVTIGNTAPVLSSVSLTPTSAAEGDTLTCTPGSASDADGDTITYTYAWFVDSVQVAPTTTTLGDTFWERGESVYCQVTPSDGTDTGSAVDSNAVTIDNTAPSISTVSISPSTPSASDTLTCSYSGFSDADGDADASTYAWTISGTTVGTSSTLSSGFVAGDTVTCTVTPSDGTDSGTAVADSVTVQNNAPVMSSVTITPTSPTAASTLTCTPAATDADGDTITYTYDWTVGGTSIGASSTLSSGFSSGDTVTCTVTPSDGTDSGSSLADAVTIGNTAPVLSSVSLTPTSATEGDTLTCTPGSASDADGDTITYTYAWFVDSVQVAPTTATLGDTFWERGDTVYCQVTPSDGTDTGSAVDSNAVTIDNAPPSISTVSVSPSTPSASDTLTCSYSGFSDADGDADASTYAWTVGGTTIGTSSTLSSGFSTGDTVTCTVTPSDGTDTGTALADSVTIQNTAPVMSSVTVTPTSPTVSSTLTCTPAATDADGDTITYTYDWTVGGTTIGTSSTLSSGFSSGDTVTCTVTPSDGTDSGSSLADAVTIGNTAPVLSSVSLTPTSATEGDTLTCTPGSASDADGDTITYTYAWFVDSVQVAPTTATLGDTYWERGESVYCQVTPSDGTDTGSAVDSNAVTIDNSAPSISSVSISPTTPSSGDTLTCSYSGFSDADGDADASTYAWTVGGTTIGTSSTLSSGFSSGDTVTCTVTPSDGTDSGTAIADSVTVQNTAPVMTSVSVTPNTPTVSSTLTCTPAATDADGDSITYSYAWTIGGTPVGTASTLSSGFSRGDTVVCTVTPSDGTDTGSSLADSELIENSAPSVSSVTLSPSAPVYASTLTVSYSSTDADGDSVSVSYAWYVNGSQVSTASSLSVSSVAVKGDSIYATLTPTDGFDSGTSESSSTATVGNTAPSAPAVDATDDPEVGVDDILCDITTPSTDVDAADAVSYVIEWEADGAVYPDDYGSATGPDTTTYTDDTIPAADTSLATDWTCTVVATDGTDDSSSVSDTTTTVAPSSTLDTTRAGYTYGVTGSYTSNASNFAIAEPYTMASSAVVTGFGFNWAFGYCTTCELGVHSDSSGPDVLYGEVVSSSCGTTSGGNNEVSGSGFSVPSGSVWLSWNFASCNYGTDYYIADSGGSTNTVYYASDTAGDGLPDPWTSSNSTSMKASSVYPIGY